jgi:hypothetical protein
MLNRLNVLSLNLMVFIIKYVNTERLILEADIFDNISSITTYHMEVTVALYIYDEKGNLSFR